MAQSSSFERKTTIFKIQLNLQKKYFNAFYFYMAKSINEIIADYPTPCNILIKDFHYLDNRDEYLTNYFQGNNLKINLSRNLNVGGKSRFEIHFHDQQISKILLKGCYQKRNLFSPLNNYNKSYIEDPILNIFSHDHILSSTDIDISYSWTLHDIYKPDDSLSKNKNKELDDSNLVYLNKSKNAKNSENTNPTSKLRFSKDAINYSNREIFLENSDQTSPRKYKLPLTNIQRKIKKLNIDLSIKTNPNTFESKKERDVLKNFSGKVYGNTIEIPKLIMKFKPKKAINCERNIKTERDKYSNEKTINKTSASKGKASLRIGKVVSAKCDEDRKIKNKRNEQSPEGRIKSIKIVSSRPASGLVNEYFTKANKTQNFHPPQSIKLPLSSKRKPELRNSKFEKIDELMSGTFSGTKSDFDEEKFKKIMSMAKQGKDIFNEIKQYSIKKPAISTSRSTTQKNQPFLAMNFKENNGFWTSRKYSELSEEF